MASIIKADTLQSTTANVFVLNSSGTEYARFDSTGVFQLANPTTFPAGTAALPSITATGDTNTGIFFPAADTIAFSEGGGEIARFDSSSNLLFGSTSNPFNSKFYVTETPTANAPIASFYSQGNSSTSGIGLYNDSASVGIWTSSGNLTFRTNGNLASGVETMRIDSSGNLLFNSGYGSVATAYGCRAWVNFNGIGTVAIRASGNVSSITDNGTGDYTINFTTAMTDTNYCFSGVAEPATGNTNYTVFGGTSSTAFTRTTSSIRIRTGYVSSTVANATVSDADVVNVAIFR